ncbi:MAG: response regulator, partial [Deltaproteobacteria bacterium]
IRMLERHRLERLAGNTSPRVFEMEVFDRDGNLVPLEVKTGPVLKDGEIVGIQVVARDIRERREMEQKFLQAQKLEAIGRLAAGVAHDFNNLLTTILGYVDLAMVDASEGLASPDLLKEIKAASLKASVLTQRLLAFSRKTVVSPIVIDLNAAISDMGKLLKRVIGEDIELIVERAETELAVRIDPVLFEQVVLNLAINARDAMPEGGKLVIRLRAVDVDEDYAAVHEGISPGRYHELSVSDTGTGMSREVRERIFDPFFTTKEAGKGTGLGLSTVREIVESQGGHIIVYSEVGKGSTFRVLWPPAGEKACSVRAGGEQQWLGGSESILIVEDEESVRTVLKNGLERAGYRVFTVRDAHAALGLLGSGQRIDAVLSDVVLPGGLDGVSLAERIRTMHDGVRVLLMSGYAGEVVIDGGRLANYRLLQKPFAMNELLDAVREVLDS